MLAGLSNEVSGGALSLSLRAEAADLNASTPAMQLVMTLSKLMFGAFMLLGGLLGDSYGRRRVLVLGCGGVVAASVLAALGGLGVWCFASEAKAATRPKLDGLGALGVAAVLLALVFGVVTASSRRSSRCSTSSRTCRGWLPCRRCCGSFRW